MPVYHLRASARGDQKKASDLLGQESQMVASGLVGVGN